MKSRYIFPAALVFPVLFIVFPAAVNADIGLLVYPVNYAIFTYDPTTYAIKEWNDPQYDPAFGVAGQMLWNMPQGRVAFEAYRAPGLSGFDASSTGRSEFYTAANTATIAVDGFSEYPRQLSDIYVEFQPYPVSSTVDVFVNGKRVDGLRHVIPSMIVATPIGHGFYSNTVTFDLRWVGAQFIRIFAYADKNGNRVYDGEPSCDTLMEDLTVPAEPVTWGAIKSLYGD